MNSVPYLPPMGGSHENINGGVTMQHTVFKTDYRKWEIHVDYYPTTQGVFLYRLYVYGPRGGRKGGHTWITPPCYVLYTWREIMEKELPVFNGEFLLDYVEFPDDEVSE